MTEECEVIYKEAVQAGLCKHELKWIEGNGINYCFIREYNYKLYLWGVGNCPSWEIDKDNFDVCVTKNPFEALMYVEDTLTYDQFDSCLKEYPEVVVKYYPERLTEAQLEYCIKHSPIDTIMYANKFLTKVQREEIENELR